MDKEVAAVAFVWKSVLLVICSVILIRISGRKSISQMTVASTVILFSLGEILVQPIVNQQIGITLLTVAAFLGTLALLEYLQLKFKLLEKWFSGEAVALIENGRILPEQLRRTRVTVRDLEKRFRTMGIVNLSDVKTATLESNGQIGYELHEDAQPVKMKQWKELLQVLSDKPDTRLPASAVPVSRTDLVGEKGADEPHPPSPLQ